MFELNNLGVFVASPLQRWLHHLDALPAGEQAAAFQAAGGPGGSSRWQDA